MPTLASFFGFTGDGCKGAGAGDVKQGQETPIKPNKKRPTGDSEGSGIKKSKRSETKSSAAEPPAGGEHKIPYDKEKEDEIRRQIEAMEAASENEVADIEAVCHGMVEYMENQPNPCKADSMKSYALNIKMLQKRDGRSFSAMGSGDYYPLIKSMWENKRVHGSHSAAVKKFQEFYAETLANNDGTFKLSPKWLELAEETKRVDERGLKLRSIATAEQTGSRVVGINKDDKGRWVANYSGKRLGAFDSEELAVQAILRAKRGIFVNAPVKRRSLAASVVGMKPLNWAKPKPAAESPASGADAAGTLSEQSAIMEGVNSSEITEIARSVSIVDPVSLARIEIPVRGKECRHLGVFDKATYIEFNEMKAKMCGRLSKLWNCPICNTFAKPELLVVVPAFVEVLASVRDLPDVEQVDVMPDGRLQVPGSSGAKARASAPACSRQVEGEDLEMSDTETTGIDSKGGSASQESGESPSASAAGAANEDAPEPQSSTDTCSAEQEQQARLPHVTLTEEQRQMIAVKRQEALERRRLKELEARAKGGS